MLPLTVFVANSALKSTFPSTPSWVLVVAHNDSWPSSFTSILLLDNDVLLANKNVEDYVGQLMLTFFNEEELDKATNEFDGEIAVDKIGIERIVLDQEEEKVLHLHFHLFQLII